MHVLVIGSGGREQAIAWTCRRHGHRVAIAVGLPDPSAPQPDLVIVGPEDALVAGVADECARRGVACFGPTAALARLEGSKAHARAVAEQLGIPSPAYATFESAAPAVAWWQALGRPIVVKQSGLAAGKGVVVPIDDDETGAAIESLAATGPIVLEERLYGTECSLISLCDGRTSVPLPIAQDHKRIGEGDTGPNTGGMGAFAPAPVAYSSDELDARFVRPVVDALAAAGTPYVGVLYAGLMLTADGPRLLEWNCRFGDPETQALLALLDSDLAELALACTRGVLAASAVRIRAGSACTVVAASGGYPAGASAPGPITGVTAGVLDGVVAVGSGGGDGHDGPQVAETEIFVSGARVEPDGSLTATGGRVLAVTGWAGDLGTARAAAYARMATISFPGMQVRRDIAWRAPGGGLRSYADAGVDIDEGARAVEMLKASVERTHTPAVLQGVGSFGGAFDVSALKAFDRPILVASTDGVGTKVELAARAGRPEVSGMDIVNHCVGDVLVQGARPLFFLDYIAASHLDADHVASVVDGMAKACEASGCVLLGGETAEMPGVYVEGAFDVAGTLVGVVEHARMLPRADVGPGDVLVGVASSGPHTNGYSLLRSLFAWIPLDAQPEPLDRPLADALLAPHRSYLTALSPALDTGKVKALAHITGGGLPENVPRILPAGCGAVIELGSWPVPPLFRLVQELATGLSVHELHRTLNMGIGMVVVCAAGDVEQVRAAIGEETWVIGRLVPGARTVELRDADAACAPDGGR
jgi:phosphoribosylamine--glycine ligase/phosphoribosylaminoimidazole synthetase